MGPKVSHSPYLGRALITDSEFDPSPSPEIDWLSQGVSVIGFTFSMPIPADRDAARAAAVNPNQASTSSAASGSQAAPSSSAGTGGASKPAARAVSDKAAKVDEAYFDSYGGFDIHREMISDKVGWGDGQVRFSFRNGHRALQPKFVAMYDVSKYVGKNIGQRVHTSTQTKSWLL